MVLDQMRNVLCLVCWTSVFLSAATGQTMWPDYVKFSKISTSNYHAYITGIPFTYHECITHDLEVNYNGYVSFGVRTSLIEPPPPSKWPFSPKYMGVYWVDSKFDSEMKSSTYIYYNDERLRNITHTNSLMKYVKDVIGEPQFEPLTVVAVTWENVRPRAVATYPNDTATFQLLLATDSQVSYAIRGYQQLWQSPELYSKTYYSGTYSLAVGQRPKITTPRANTGPEVMRLGTKKPNKDPYTCVEKTLTAVVRLNSSLYALPPCPCYKTQAAKDQQFKMAVNVSGCYQGTNAPKGGSLLQLCCYNQYGLLIKFGKEARVPVSAVATDRSLQDAYEKCCAAGSGLCEWFYYRIFQPKCSSYSPALSASEVPSFINPDDEFVYIPTDQGPPFIRGLAANSRYALTYRADSAFSRPHGFRFDSTSFSWDVAEGRNELRKMAYPQRLVFYATDTNNMSASFAPLFKLCLCEQAGQCVDSTFTVADTRDRMGMKSFFGLDNYNSGNVNSMTCNCPEASTGRFCEKSTNACDDCLVHDTSSCAANPEDYCPSCPSGYQKSGGQCRAGGGSSIYRNTCAEMCLFVALACVSAALPWMQNS